MVAVSGCSSQIRLNLNWKILLLGLLLLPLLLRLGFWQLQRAEEKQLVLQSLQQQRALPTVDLSTLKPGDSDDDLQHRSVRAWGRYDTQRFWLIDNKVQRGKVGYELVVPFYLERGGVVLVNRGWLPAPLLRSQLPEVDIPVEPRSILGRLFQGEPNLLIKNLEQEKGWPRRLQQIDLDVMAEQLQSDQRLPDQPPPLYHWRLRLSVEDPSALLVDWQYVSSGPAKHQGYAVQWFSMAAVLLIALIFANTNLASRFYNNNKGVNHDG